MAQSSQKIPLSSVWVVSPSIVIWEIWKERNRRIFLDKKESLKRLLCRIDHSIEEVVGVAASQLQFQRIPFSLEDSRLQRACSGFKVRPSKLEEDLPMKRMGVDVVWEKPSEGWHKANFDRAAKGNPRPSGAGAIVRDSLGNTIAIGAKKLDEGTNNVIEGKAALLVVCLARAMGAKKLHLEGDSMVVTQAITNGGIKALHLQVFINLILKELESFVEFKMSHIRQASNGEANSLSNWIVSFSVTGEVRVEDFCYVCFEDEVA